MAGNSNAINFGETRSFKVLSPGTMISHYKIIEKIGRAVLHSNGVR